MPDLDALPDPFAVVAPTLRALNDAGRPQRRVRLWRPWPIMAFSRRDERSPHFAAAIDVAVARGFQPAVRPVGGTFAPLHPGSLVVDEYGWTAGLHSTSARFERHAGLLAAVFRALGVDAQVGEVPGEYCPGAHSVNRGGAVKISGTAQRVSRQAWLVSSVVQVRDAAALRDAAASVAAALRAHIDPATIGSLDETVPGVTVEAVASLVSSRFVDDGADLVEWAG